MRPLTKVALAALVVLASAAVTLAHVRLIHSGNGIALRWNTPANISIVINEQGSDDITDQSHITALRNAIRSWNSVPGSTVHLSEDSSPAQMARTDYQSSSLHLILFDENDSSGYFPGGTGIVALTPVWFSNSGVITDADILFNGQDFEFTTSGVPGRFDVQDVATHELGHLLGLDHTDWAGGTMYPYVDPTVILHRSLAQDEVHGLARTHAEAIAELSTERDAALAAGESAASLARPPFAAVRDCSSCASTLRAATR